MSRATASCSLAALLLLTACGRPEPDAPAGRPGASIDAAAAQALLSCDETLQSITLDETGPTTVTGEVAGYRSTAWAVAVGAGRALSVRFEPSNTHLYMKIADTADPGGTTRLTSSGLSSRGPWPAGTKRAPMFWKSP